MKRISSSLPIVAAAAVFLFFIAFSPAGVDATEHRVTSGSRIQDVLSSGTFTSGDTIVVEPGEYFGPIFLPSNVIIKGTETARTFLNGMGGTAVTVNAATTTGSVTIQNFTFINASIGISLMNNTSNNNGITVTITNNVFQVGFGGTAIFEQFSTLTAIVNNTFYQNGTALSCDWDIDISNNIFSTNNIAITDTSYTISKIVNNAFFGNGTNGPTGPSPIEGDPLFVDRDSADLVNDPRDFHLREGSLCIGKGPNGTDVGAYGGLSADKIPFPVAGLTILSATTSTTEASIDLTWLPNYSHLVTNSSTTLAGGYKLYFGSAPGDYTCTIAICRKDSPENVGLVTAASVTSLTISSTLPSAPENVQSSPQDSRLLLTWSPVSGATGYKVHYGISSVDEYDPIDIGNTTSYELSGLAGLTNGQYYYVAVSAYTQQQYFFAVTAYNHTDTTTFEESVKSTETSTLIGPKRESVLSNVVYDFPEPVITYPALPDTGGRCFIATAAYGYYSAPEVRVLRAFRDQYLLASAPGRMFVQWYYRHGPAAASFLNNHPGYKPLVRTALMPAIGAAIFLTETSMMFKAGVFLTLGAFLAYGFFRKRLSVTGGLR